MGPVSQRNAQMGGGGMTLNSAMTLRLFCIGLLSVLGLMIGDRAHLQEQLRQCEKSAKTVAARKSDGGAATISNAKPLANGTMITAEGVPRDSSRHGERQSASSSSSSSSSVGIESGGVKGVKPVAVNGSRATDLTSERIERPRVTGRDNQGVKPVAVNGSRATDLTNERTERPQVTGRDNGAVIQPPAVRKEANVTLKVPQRPPSPPPPSHPGSFQCRDNIWYRAQLAKKQKLPTDKHNNICKWEKEDEPFLKDGKPPGIRSYLVVNEPRTGSSWLQEVSYYHSGIKVQFELDFVNSFDALRCQQCARPRVPNSKYTSKIPSKSHPPEACGMTVFGKANDIGNVCEAAKKHDAYLVLLLRMNHVAHAISMYFAFESRKKVQKSVPWDFHTLSREVSAMRLGFDNLQRFISGVNAPTYVIFYENMKREPEKVWNGLQSFLKVSESTNHRNLTQLHPKARSGNSLSYLRNLTQLRETAIKHEVWWQDMLLNDMFDDDINFDREFFNLCEANAGGNQKIFWKDKSCMDVLGEKRMARPEVGVDRPGPKKASRRLMQRSRDSFGGLEDFSWD